MIIKQKAVKDSTVHCVC